MQHARHYAIWGTVTLVLVAIVVAQTHSSPLHMLRNAAYDDYEMMDGDFSLTASSAPAIHSDKTMFYAEESLGQTAADVAQRIIKTADLALQVDDVAVSSQQTNDLATAAGGFVQSSTVNEDSIGNRYGYVTIRIPVDAFATTLASLKAGAEKVVSESTNGQDVTEQYTDLKARLNAAQAQEAQYIVILASAKTVGEVLAVQEHLGEVRSTVESLQGQLNYLGNRTELATISVTFTENTRVTLPSEKFDLGDEIKDAAKTLIVFVQRIIAAIVWAIIVGGPFVLIAFAAYLGYRAWERRRDARN